MVARGGQIKNGGGLGGLAGSKSYGGNTALQRCQAGLQGILRGVGQAGINRSGIREVEAVGGVLGIVEDVRRGLVNRHVACVGGAVQVLASVEGARGKRPLAYCGIIVLSAHAWQR